MPSADVAVRLAKVLGVTVEWLVTGENEIKTDEDIQSLIHYFSHLTDRDKKLILDLAKNMISN